MAGGGGQTPRCLKKLLSGGGGEAGIPHNFLLKNTSRGYNHFQTFSKVKLRKGQTSRTEAVYEIILIQEWFFRIMENDVSSKFTNYDLRFADL